jgi:YVTN family beta-propeller protein
VADVFPEAEPDACGMSRLVAAGCAMFLPALVALALPAPAAANELYVVNQTSGDVSVIDTATNTVDATIPVAPTPFAVAITPDGGRAYVTSAASENVTVIDTATRSVTASVAVGGSQAGVAVAPDGSRVYVASGSQNTVSVIDTATDTLVDSIDVPAGPRAVAVTPDGERVYVTSTGVGAQFAPDVVSAIDADAGAVTATMPVGGEPVAITVTPDGRRVFVASPFGSLGGLSDVSIIDTATDIVAGGIAFSFPFAIAASPANDRVYVASTRLAQIAVPTGAMGSSVVIGNGLNAIAVAPDGARAYVPSNAADTVSVVDTAAMSVLEAIGVGDLPMGVAIAPNRSPAAGFTSAAAGGATAVFDARSSSDPDTEIVRYDWDFGDGASAPDGGPSPTHIYAAPGTYDVTLTVTDALGCSTEVIFTGQTASCEGAPRATTTRTVTVGAPPPPDCEGDSVAVAHATPTAIALSCRGEVEALRIVAPPRHGRVAAVDQQDRTVVYTPDPGYSGADRIRFAADGPGGGSGPATIALTVGAPPTAAPPSPPPSSPREPAADNRPPRVSRVRLSRRRLTMRVSERAALAITIGRCRITRSRGDACRTARRLSWRTAGSRTVRIRLRPRLRAGRYRITVRAVDVAGNRLRTSVVRGVPR